MRAACVFGIMASHDWSFVLPSTKKSRVALKYKMWPSSLKRAGHTTVSVDDPDQPLFQYLTNFPKNQAMNIHMGRMCRVPCLLQPTSKFRHGAPRWWCPVHQGSFGKKRQLESAKSLGVRRCEHADDPVDFVRVSDIPELCLVPAKMVKEAPNYYCELGIWIGLPPAVDTSTEQRFFPGIHVHARKEPGGPKVIDTNYPAVLVKDKTGRFPALPPEGIFVTSPTALEYLYYMENQCPVNRQIMVGGGSAELPHLPRSPVVLEAQVRCKHCQSLHEDVGDFFGETEHKKHLCGQCGRDIFNKGRVGNIGNPLGALRREFRREVVGTNIDPQNAELRIETKDGLRLMMWPSTPAIFWSRETPEIWGIHVHGTDSKGVRVIDDTYGHVYLDGRRLNRHDLFSAMLEAAGWMEEYASDEGAARMGVELEDD